MSFNDSLFIVVTCGVLIILPIAITVIVLLVSRRGREQDSQAIITPTEYGWLKQFSNGDLATGFNQGRTLAVIGLVSLGLVGCWLSAIGGQSNSLAIALALTAICMPILFVFFRILFQRTLYFDSTQRLVEVRRIGDRRQMPSSDAQYFLLKEWQTRSRYGGRPVFWGKLSLKLKSGEVVDVGTISTMVDAQDLKARCEELGAWVSKAAGVRLEINSEDKSRVDSLPR